ncbi:MAG: hypothetical protein IPK27_17930 [Rhodanobacteraceae bacterium]|nr:hypothetical protein [Rhodanobacteraceae bacterium]
MLWAESDIVLKVAVPTTEEVGSLREGGTLIGFIWPAVEPGTDAATGREEGHGARHRPLPRTSAARRRWMR